jgi:hypothetical protein
MKGASQNKKLAIGRLCDSAIARKTKIKRLWQGRLWSLVLISEAIAPVTMAWLINH